MIIVNTRADLDALSDKIVTTFEEA